MLVVERACVAWRDGAQVALAVYVALSKAVFTLQLLGLFIAQKKRKKLSADAPACVRLRPRACTA